MINTLSAGKDNFYRQMLKLTIPIIIHAEVPDTAVWQYP